LSRAAALRASRRQWGSKGWRVAVMGSNGTCRCWHGESDYGASPCVCPAGARSSTRHRSAAASSPPPPRLTTGQTPRLRRRAPPTTACRSSNEQVGHTFRAIAPRVVVRGALTFGGRAGRRTSTATLAQAALASLNATGSPSWPRVVPNAIALTVGRSTRRVVTTESGRLTCTPLPSTTGHFC
jgi:hypothetical protein